MRWVWDFLLPTVGPANSVVPSAVLDDAIDTMIEQVLRVPSDLAYRNKRLTNRTLDLIGVFDGDRIGPRRPLHGTYHANGG